MSPEKIIRINATPPPQIKSIFNKPVNNNMDYDTIVSVPKLLKSEIPNGKKVIKLHEFSGFGTNNAEQNANAIYEQLGKYNILKEIKNTKKNREQYGGGNELYSVINSLYSLYQIYNSNILLHIIGLISDRELLTELYITITKEATTKVPIIDFINIFFCKASNYQEILNAIGNLDNTRDTTIYSKYNEDGEYIFIYKLLTNIHNYINNPDNIYNLTANPEISTELALFISEITQKLSLLKNQYKSIYSQKTKIKEVYTKLIYKHKRIFTFVKSRLDTLHPNPRFNIGVKDNITINSNQKIAIQNKYLTLEYINSDADINTGNKEYYFLGPFDGVYVKKESNQQIAKETKVIIDKLNNGIDVCVIGYGQSGSGKTSSLIFLNYNDGSKDVKLDGILMEICNLKELKTETLSLQMKNIFINYSTKKTAMDQLKVSDGDYTVTDIMFNMEYNKVQFRRDPINKKWINGSTYLGEYIINGFEDGQRQIEPTPNNPDSSRSHVIICITLDNAKFFICDFAGVENVFDCNNINELLKFDNKYNMSKKYKGKDVKLDKYLCDYHNEDNTSMPIMDEYRKVLQEGKILEYIDRYNKSNSILYFALNLKNIKNKTSSNQEVNTCVDIKIEDCMKSISTDDTDINSIKNKLDSFINTIDENIKDMTLLLSAYNSTLSKKDEMLKDNKSKIDKLTILKNDDFNFESKNSKYINFKKYILDNLNKIDSTKIEDAIKTKKFHEHKIGNYLTFIKDENKVFHKNIKAKIEENKLNENIVEYKRLLCNYIRLKAIGYNCNIRRTEGYMINRSLKDIAEDIQQLLLSSVAQDNILPLFYEKEIYPYCLNSDIETSKLDFFDKPINNNRDDGILFKTLIDMGSDTKTMNFVVMTVINLNQTVNNPPNPPFINLNTLKYYLETNKNKEKLNEELKNVQDKILQYEFYRNQTNSEFKNLLVYSIENEQSHDYETNIKKLIDFIEINNASTLIGSIATTEQLQNIVYTKKICSYSDNGDINDNINDYNIDNGFGKLEDDSNIDIKQLEGRMKMKYLKYKNKYLDLKNDIL